MRAKPCYSLRYDKHQSNPTQSQQCGHILQLWKSCVLPHYLLYLRYLCSEDQIQQLQVSLNQSLSSTLRVGGHAQALLADPPSISPSDYNWPRCATVPGLPLRQDPSRSSGGRSGMRQAYPSQTTSCTDA